MDNHQQNSMNAASNPNANPAGNNQEGSSGRLMLPKNAIFGGIQGNMISPQMFQDPDTNTISASPALLYDFITNRKGTITPSIASHSSSALPKIEVAKSSTSATSSLQAVTATLQSTETSGVIVPGVGNRTNNSNGKAGHTSQINGAKAPKRQRRITSVAAAATSALAAAPGPTPTTTLGGVVIPSIHPQASTALQVQIAAATAAAAAAPVKQKGGGAHAAAKRKAMNSISEKDEEVNELSLEEKAKLNRDRNREHARSTRLRKKAYVNKLKELVEGLHAERTEETKKNKVAVQHLSEVQAVRKSVMRTFLKYLSNYESDHRKWDTLMEDNFWFKQPITPYRSFPRNEIEHECRITKGIDGMICESASMSVMIEGIGSRSARWMHIKRDEFLRRQDNTPSTVMEHNTNIQQAVSSLSSSSGSSNGNGSGCEDDLNPHRNLGSSVRANGKNCNTMKQLAGTTPHTTSGAKKVSAGSSGSEYRHNTNNNTSNEYHIYNAPSLPDPKYSGESGAGSDSALVNSACTDSSSTDEDNKQPIITTTKNKIRSDDPVRQNTFQSTSNTHTEQAQQTGLPCNIAKKGGISHNIRPLTPNLTLKSKPARDVNDRLSASPVIPLPPFLGIGKKAQPVKKPGQGQPNGTTQISSKPPLTKLGSGSDTVSAGPLYSTPGTSTDTSNSSLRSKSEIKAFFHVNEDDMLITDDVLMCSFIFRSQEAIMCGALAECIMPGMLRASFSSRNKLHNLEMVYDAMGFMQQLERASGREGTAQIIPNSLDMALVPIADEARVLTLAKPPFLIVSVNEAWTKMTKYTQMDAEGKEFKILHGKRTDPNAAARPGKPIHDFEHITSGRCACSVNRHYDKLGSEFIEYSCTYPLSNSDNEVTHLLHISKELPAPIVPCYENHETRSTSDSLNSNEEVEIL